MAKTVSSGKRHFKYKHPLFRKRETEQGIWWEDSHYYIWFECLLRNEGYKKFCETGKDKKYAKTFEGFGNVFDFTGNFKGWWNENSRGLYLFAEPHAVNASILDVTDTILDNDEIIYLQLPAYKPEAYLFKKMRELIRLAQKQRKIDASNTAGQSRYPFCQSPHSTYTYKNYLKVWDLRQRGLKNSEIHDAVYGGLNFNRYAKQWIRKKGYYSDKGGGQIVGAITEQEVIDSCKLDIRRQIQKYQSAVVKRAFDGAENLINNAGIGLFPKTSK
ncbi:hypothetical protein [Magnetovibrio blakemorei]|uniref:Uncharacterized protein n=1 Tax=Magnetovibrio blakemorei TaxID=28181 RepID=A0A1E5Q4N7_9PROT|nr:hypothetical protein [Magnetovibrio blakemorei]OEJ65195.1 hypothetical protein BEN30_15090 [Magnetovibrio blakemorei]